MIGRVLSGRYELGEILGQGGMAVVYRALDRILDREVAVKLLRDQYAADPEFLERFQREARAAARLSHPNVVDIYDVGSDDGTHFIVMELVDGENLKDLVRRSAPLPPARVIALGRELAAALDYAHRRGLVHRDVKPQNVLLDPEGHPRLTDFGIAEAAEQGGLTQPGMVMGTAQYMAPEQASGRPTTPASDLYSLGVVLYELATGQLPFEGDSPVSVSLQHLQDEPAPPRRLNPSVPTSLEAVILRAMAKDPSRRFASGAELAQALVEGPNPVRERTVAAPVVAERPRRPERPPGRREQATAVAPASPRPRPPVSPRPTRRPQSGGTGPVGAIVMVLMVLMSLAFLFLGFNWLFGPSRPVGTGGDPTSVPTTTRAPAVVTSPSAVPTATRPAATPTLPTSPTIPAATPPPTVAPTPTAPATATPPPPPTKPAAPPPTKPAARSAVPNLVGLSLAQAEEHARSRNLILELENAEDPSKPTGTILSQSPPAGESVAERSVVRVRVNRVQSATVTVPNVSGLEEGRARQQLQQAGFKVNVESGSGGSKGTVYDQSPQPGVRVAPGTEVTIWIGS